MAEKPKSDGRKTDRTEERSHSIQPRRQSDPGFAEEVSQDLVLDVKESLPLTQAPTPKPISDPHGIPLDDLGVCEGPTRKIDLKPTKEKKKPSSGSNAPLRADEDARGS